MERGEAVQDGDTHLELGNLTVKVPRGQALPQQLNAVHLGLCTASSVIPAPSSPDGPADALRFAQDSVARDCTGGVRFPGFSVLPRRDDGGGGAGGGGVMAFAGVEGAIGGDGLSGPGTSAGDPEEVEEDEQKVGKAALDAIKESREGGAGYIEAGLSGALAAESEKQWNAAAIGVSVSLLLPNLVALILGIRALL